MILQGNVQRFCHGIQLIPVEVRQQQPCQGYCVQYRGIEGQPQFFRIMANKSHIKARIVGYKRGISHKLQKFRQYLVDFWVWKHHGVIDARQLLDIKGNGHLGIDEGRIFVLNLSINHFHGPDLDDGILFGAESRGLDVKHHVCTGKALASGILHQLLGVVHQIAFHPVEHLKGIALVQGVVRVRECLDAAMVCDSHCGHAPFLCPLDDALHIGDPVHITHLGVAVELHPLFQAVVHSAAGKVLPFLDAHNGAKGQLPVEFVNGGHTLNLQKHAHIDDGFYLLKKLRPDKHFRGDGVRVVRHIEGQDKLAAAQLPALARQDLAPEGHLPHLPVNLLNLDKIIVEIPAIEHIRVVGAL